MRKFTIRNWVTIIIMEIITLLITGLFVWQFVAGVQNAKIAKEPISGLAIFCLIAAIAFFVGLNVLMVFLIKSQRKKGR